MPYNFSRVVVPYLVGKCYVTDLAGLPVDLANWLDNRVDELLKKKFSVELHLLTFYKNLF
jgi:hypothetical protein